MEQLQVIRSLKEFRELKIYLDAFDLIAFDTETTGLTKRDEIIGLSVCAEENKAFYVILSEWDKEKQSLNYLETLEFAKEFVSFLGTKSLIMHNAVFDCMMCEAYFKVPLNEALHTDTMVLAHLLNENRRVGLKDLGVSVFGASSKNEADEVKASVIANGGIATKTNYEMYKADSEVLGKYGAKDAILTFKLFNEFVPELFEQGLDKFFYEDETMPLLKGPTYDLNTTGLTINVAKLNSLKATLIAECAEAKNFIETEIRPFIKDKYPGTKKSNTFNIGASQQLSWLLFGQLNLEFNTLTKGGKAIAKQLVGKLPYTFAAKRAFINECLSRAGQVYEPEAIINGKKKAAKRYKEPWAYIACDKETIKKLASKYKWLEALQGYNKKQKILNTYVEGIEERLQYGVIQPSYLQHGTSSGRYSSRNPNFQNLPRDDQRVKECIEARPGKVFVSADYSQLEPRVFAFYSGDKRLMDAFDGTTDFYSVVGIDTFDITDAVPLKEGHKDAFGVKYKHLRDATKTIALARAYGATPPQLAKTLNKSVDETADIIARYDERFPGVRAQMLEAHKLAKENGEVKSYFGRPRRMPEAKKINKLFGNIDHAELPYEARKLLNLACNHRIQSTGASLINRATIAFYRACKQAGLVVKIISQVHDELIVECLENDAEDVKALMQHCMETTNELPGIKLEAIPRISKNLAK